MIGIENANGEKIRIEFQHEHGSFPIPGKHERRLSATQEEAAEVIANIEVIAELAGAIGNELAQSFALDAIDIINDLVPQPKQPTAKAITIARIVMDHGDHSHLLAKGVSYCSPKDVFSKEKGRQIALNRALAELPNIRLAAELLVAYMTRKGLDMSDITVTDEDVFYENFKILQVNELAAVFLTEKTEGRKLEREEVVNIANYFFDNAPDHIIREIEEERARANEVKLGRLSFEDAQALIAQNYGKVA